MRLRSSLLGVWRRRLLLAGMVVAVFALALLTPPAPALLMDRDGRAQPMARITVRGHLLYAGRTLWRAWGFNWGGNSAPILKYFDDPSPTRLKGLATQLRTARRLGANSMRIFLKLGQVMETPTEVRPGTLSPLRALLNIAQQNRIYLDITGNLIWRPDQVPAWYDTLSEVARWDVQARFWSAVAHAASRSPAVLCYELTSEPLVTDGGGYYFRWVGGMSFVQGIADGRGRDTVAIARAWTKELAAAVRAEDNRPVTIGFLPILHAPIAPQTVGDLLDMIVLHVYPGQTKMSDAMLLVRHFAATRKPVLIGETGVLFCNEPLERTFLLRADRYVDGFFEWFDGRDPNHMRVSNIADAVYRASLQQFIALRTTLLRPYHSPHG